MTVLGIDVSKADFHCCLLDGDISATGKFDNKAAGFRRLRQWLRKQGSTNVHACLEATGPYWLPLAEALFKAQIRVSVVNPARTAFFAKSLLQRTKTDTVDARMLAEYCRSQKPESWAPPPAEILELRAFLTYRDQAVQQKTSLRLVIATIEADANLAKIHEAQTAALEVTIAAIEGAIAAHLEKHPSLQERVRALDVITGYGLLSAATVVAHLPVERIRSEKAAAAYAGLSPADKLSGTSVRGKPRICKTGNSELRRALYMPAVVASRYNPILREFYQRLITAGKPKKVALVAVMRKLLVLAYTRLKTLEPPKLPQAA